MADAERARLDAADDLLRKNMDCLKAASRSTNLTVRDAYLQAAEWFEDCFKRLAPERWAEELDAHEAGETFTLTRADAKLLIGDLSDYGDSPAKAMQGLLALDARIREWMGTPAADNSKPDPGAEGITITISREGAASFVSNSSGWGAIGLQEITEAIIAAFDGNPPTEPETKERH